MLQSSSDTYIAEWDLKEPEHSIEANDVWWKEVHCWVSKEASPVNNIREVMLQDASTFHLQLVQIGKQQDLYCLGQQLGMYWSNVE